MNNNLKDILNNIPLPDSLDENIKLGFDKGKRKENNFIKVISLVAASIVLILGTVNVIGLDKVEAAIKQALQYVPGYNLTIDKEDGEVLALQEPILYEKDDVCVRIMAASRLDKELNISIKSNYNTIGESKKEISKSFDNMKIYLKDEKSNTILSKNWSSSGGGSEFWQGDYNFKVEDMGKDYTLLIDDLEIPFKLEETKEVDDFLELGSYAEDKGISIVAIKKPMEDKLMISLLNKSEVWTVEDYPFNGIYYFDQFENLGIEKSMYILDVEGNKVFPTIPSSYGSLMSDFYFDILDREGLMLVLPYLSIRYHDAKTEKIRLKVPKSQETVNINKVLDLGKFELEVVSTKIQEDQILINLDIKDLKDEILTNLRVDGISGYSMRRNEETGSMEIGINLDDVGRRFSISFSSPRSILKGNWEIDLD